MRDGLSALRMAVWCPFRRSSMYRYMHRELTRNESLDLTAIVSATACHQKHYVGTYSRCIVRTISTPGGHCHEQGKTHLATALGYTACLQGYSVLFASAIDVINTLTAAKSAGRLKQDLKKYTKPALLILDELGYLPIDKASADLLFQVISLRYEQGAIIITSNRAFKEWPKIFNNDSTLTAAILDRLLHHAETVIIEGKSFRMKDQIEG
jgi:IstB-like ATP binding protein